MGIDKQIDPTEGDESYNPPAGFYAAYVKWYDDSLKDILSVITDEKSREHLMSFHKPESEEDILKRFRSLPEENRTEAVRIYMEGYEAGKKRASGLAKKIFNTAVAINRKLTGKHDCPEEDLFVK